MKARGLLPPPHTHHFPLRVSKIRSQMRHLEALGVGGWFHTTVLHDFHAVSPPLPPFFLSPSEVVVTGRLPLHWSIAPLRQRVSPTSRKLCFQSVHPTCRRCESQYGNSQKASAV